MDGHESESRTKDEQGSQVGVSRLAGPPPFSSDLASLVWPLPVHDFLESMHSEVFYHPGGRERLALLEQPLGEYDLSYLFAHGEEATVWREGGLRTTRGSDSEQDVDALVAGVTVQTHLQNRLAFCRNLISSLARQMYLRSGFCTIFASRDAYTATHFDRNYNFTIQLRGEKTWTVQPDYPGLAHPSDNLALDADRLTQMQPQLQGVKLDEPSGRQETYHLRPGDILYVPPGYWHATKCTGVSVSLNLCIEPWAWFQAVADSLVRHLEAQPEWRLPRGASTAADAARYVRSLRHVVDSIAVEDLIVDPPPSADVALDQPLRRTLGSLLVWDKKHAGVHYGVDELRFVAKGNRGRLLDTMNDEWEPVLIALAELERPTSVRELSAVAQRPVEEMRSFVQRLLDVGYLAAAGTARADGSR